MAPAPDDATATTPEGLTVSAHWGRRQSYVRISGCLDGSGVGRAAELLLLSARHTRRLDLDLSAVRRVGPTGMQLLFEAQRAAEDSGCTLRAVSVSPAVSEIISGTSLLGGDPTAVTPDSALSDIRTSWPPSLPSAVVDFCTRGSWIGNERDVRRAGGVG